jgi:hypothetical protein
MIRMRKARPRADQQKGPVDERPAVEADLDVDSDVMFVAFGGLAGKIGMPPFEFFRLAGDLPVKKLFLRDLRQAWYQLGIADERPTFDGVVDFLGKMTDQAGVRRLVFFGNSAGGYAALAAGRLMGADEVHAFSPQTFLSPELRHAHGDERWADEMARVHDRRPPVPGRFLDLAVLFAEVATTASTSHVHYGAGYDLDSAHALRLAGQQGVELHPHEGADHDLVRRMRDDGGLADILVRAIG